MPCTVVSGVCLILRSTGLPHWCGGINLRKLSFGATQIVCFLIAGFCLFVSLQILQHYIHSVNNYSRTTITKSYIPTIMPGIYDWLLGVSINYSKKKQIMIFNYMKD